MTLPSRVLAAVPQHWPVRNEIAKAADALLAQIAEENHVHRRSELAALRRDFELLAESFREICRGLCKAGYDPNEPRVPAGRPDGGQWTKEGGSATSSESEVVSDATPDNTWIPGAQYTANSPLGSDENQ